MYEQGFRWWRMGYAAAIAFVLLGMVLVATLGPAQARPGRAAMKRRASGWWVHIGLIALAALTVTPLLWMVSASFMAPGQANTLPPPLVPPTPTAEQYVTLFTRLNLFRNFLNSLLIATVTTAVSLLLNAMAGYAFAKLRFRGRDRVFGAAAGRAGGARRRSACCRCSSWCRRSGWSTRRGA